MDKFKLKLFSIFAAVVLLLALIKGYQIYQAITHGMFTPPPDAVTSYISKEESWNQTFRAVGSVQAINGATLSAQEAGKVTKINYQPGSTVEDGTVLIELDASVDEGTLRGAQAYLFKMRKTFERVTELHKKNAVSQDEFDNTQAEYDKAISAVDSLKGSINRKRITAPTKGEAGIQTVNIGDYVLAGQKLVSVYNLDKVYVNFSVPQLYSQKIKSGLAVKVTSDAIENKELSGVVTSVNPDVDLQSRNISVQATFDNPTKILKPGMFVSATVSLGDKTNAVIVPVTSINSAPYGDSVWVIKTNPDTKQSIVEEQFVKVGAKQGDFVQVLSGIDSGTEIVSSGLFKLHPKGAVTIHNEMAPSVSLNPTPKDN